MNGADVFMEIFGYRRLRMKVYLVIKQGVYMQGIFGVYDTEIKAEEAEKVAKSKEDDDYHIFRVVQADLNKLEYIGEE